CEIIITMLPDTPDVEEVLVGKEGVIEYAREGAVVIDMSTISPFTTQQIAKKLETKKIKMLDAPVSGGPQKAKEGTLSIMVGGEQEVFEECYPLLKCMGSTIVYIGPQGSGQTVKLCNQIICVLNLQAICEALILARSRNIDLSRMIEALKGGSAGSWMLENMAPKIIKGDASAGFKIKLQLKDIRLALELAEKEKIPLPGTSLVKNLYLEAAAHGEENNGNQALFKVYERLAKRNLS
ncbi:NAD(P)-dependent oxidoreductase, partial [Candidatus Aerophobetes bacterium]|nr:NAD(P)-dependent oxidoreductase [Candidatus Aerophobetes bacterium]